jgi:hypothetical protein
MRRVSHTDILLDHLLGIDLAGFDVTDFPVTSGLLAQHVLSLDTIGGWYRDLLLRGQLIMPSMAAPLWPASPFVTTGALYDDLQRYAREQRARDMPTREAMGKYLNDLGLTQQRPRGAVQGEAARPRGYTLGTLEAARAHYTARAGLPLDDD